MSTVQDFVRSVIIAINSYAIPVLRYSAGIINWTQSDLDEIDHKARKLMTIYGGLHPKSDVHCLYLPRNSGGRGLNMLLLLNAS